MNDTKIDKELRSGKKDDAITVQRLDGDVDREGCIRWFACDPIHHLMLLGDLYPPLIDVSEIFVATNDSGVVGVGSLSHGFATPSVVISESDPLVQQALFTTIHKQIEADWLTFYSPASSHLFSQFGKQIHFHLEQQMILQKKISMPLRGQVRFIQRRERGMLSSSHFGILRQA